MAKVTALKPQKNKKRLNIYLDGRFSFGIDLDNLVKYDIRVDKILSDEEIQKILKDSEFQKTFDKLLNFVTFRPRSKKEVTDWFKRKKVHESLHDDLIQRLEKLEMLDDLRFANWWIDQRLAFKNKSKRALKFELLNKGINVDIIEEVLSNTSIDETELAAKLIERKKARWDRLDPQDRKTKMIEFLMRNGFSWTVVKEVIERYNLGQAEEL